MRALAAQCGRAAGGGGGRPVLVAVLFPVWAELVSSDQIAPPSPLSIVSIVVTLEAAPVALQTATTCDVTCRESQYHLGTFHVNIEHHLYPASLVPVIERSCREHFLDDDSYLSRIRHAGSDARAPHRASPRVRRQQQQRGRGGGAQVRQVRDGAELDHTQCVPD